MKSHRRPERLADRKFARAWRRASADQGFKQLCQALATEPYVEAGIVALWYVLEILPGREAVAGLTFETERGFDDTRVAHPARDVELGAGELAVWLLAALNPEGWPDAPPRGDRREAIWRAYLELRDRGGLPTPEDVRRWGLS